jgi:PAS domain S-box-containing protein
MIGKGKNTNEYAAGEMAAWYKEIVDNSHDLIQCVDSEGKLVYVNQSWLSTLNYSAEEIESITLWDIIHPDSMEHCMTVFQQVIAGKAVGKVEAIFVAKDGTPVLVEGNVGLKLDEDGRFIYTRGIFRDVSELKQANEEILKRDAMLQKIFDLLPVGLWFADEKGKLLRGNPEGVRIWGGEPHVDQSDYGVFKAWRLPSGEEIAPDDWALAHTVNEGITVADEMLEIEDLKGQKKIVLNYTAPVVDDKGKIQGAIVVNQDITELKQTEESLKKIEWMLSQKRTTDSIYQAEDHDQGYGDLTELNRGGIILRSISPELIRSFSNDYMELLGTSSAIYEVNGDYAFGIFSSGWCRMMDRASRKLCNTSDNSEALNSGQWLCHESCWTDCSKEAILTRKQVDIECKGGLRLYAVPIIANGEVVGTINFGYGDPPEDRIKLQELAVTYQVNYDDLIREARAYETRPPYIIEMAKNRLHATARLIGSMIETKRAEAEILKLNEALEQRVKERTNQLEAVNKELESFAYSVSHDFRAPLRALDGFSASLQANYDKNLDDQGRHYLNRIRNAAIYMSNLVDDLLDLSRITRREFVKQQVDLSKLASGIVTELQEAEPQRKVRIKIAPDLQVRGDAALLQAALQNLLENAWKFSSKEAQAEIEVGRTTVEGEAVFFVRDNGVGFNMAYAKNLFGAFQRLHKVGEFPGTGIGLATVQRIINRHGGRIWAESEVGKGATFFFTLP